MKKLQRRAKRFKGLTVGFWYYNPRYCRSAGRDRFVPGRRYYCIGFRVVVVAPRTPP